VADLPKAVYLWIVPSEHVQEQPGSWRIRKWDTEPFPEATHAAGLRSESGLCLDKIEAILTAEGADLDICAPGNHGGRGDDANRWLVTITPADHRNIREYFGDTLADALRASHVNR